MSRKGIVRLNNDGSVDTSFDPGNGASGYTVYSILPLPDGKILVGGSFTSFGGVAREYLARLHSNGSLDTGFSGPNFAGASGSTVECLAAQADGKILVGGSFYLSGTPAKIGICRLQANGPLDTTFNGVTDGAQKAVGDFTSGRIVKRIAVQPDGKILLAGTFSAFNNIAQPGVARLTSSGSLDAGFAPQPNNYCHALCLLPDQSILIGGDFTSVSGTTATRVARISSSGVVDANFAGGTGSSATIRDFALQPDGNVVLGSNYGSYQGASPTGPVWRLVSGLAGSLGVHEFEDEVAAGFEGNSVSIQVSRTGGSLGNLIVAYSTVPGSGTATAGADYTTTSGTLTWANGDTTSKTITIPLLADGLTESPETFLVNLGEPLIGGVILAARQQLSVTIHDSGANAPPFFVSDPAMGENATEGASYVATLAGAVIDLNGDLLTFAKVNGPSWLTVSANGSLSGIPGPSDVGENSFVIRVSDGIAAPVEATLVITVIRTTTLVPNVAGLAQATAEWMIRSAGFTVGNVTTTYSTTVAAGNVISQSPLAGTTATFGASVGLLVSLGEQTYPLSVANGTGSGSYTAGQQVAVAATIPGGYVFVKWTGDTAYLANPNAATTTVTMPAGPAGITANFAINNAPVVNAGPDQTIAFGGPFLWSPAQLSPVAWYDASDATTITKDGNGFVSEWRDKSGNGKHAVQLTAANQPEIAVQSLNGLPLITARNGAKFMSVTSGPSMRMGMAMVNVRSTRSLDLLVVGSTSSSTHEFFIRGTAAQLSFDGSGNTTGKYSKNGGAFSTFAKDHTVTSAGAHIWSGVFTNSNTLNFIINRDNLASDTVGHDVGEILWFGSEIAAANREKVEGYLAQKWGQAGNLATSHPFKNTPPRNSLTVNLDGTVTDSDGTPTTTWSLVSGPANAVVVFGNAAAVDTTATITMAGTYILRLTANDGTDTVLDEVTIAVVESGPVASFAISGIPARVPVGQPVNGITITAKDASGSTADSFTGTVNFGGTAGITGTSANFVAGVLTGASITPRVAGAGLTFTVNDGASHNGTATFDVLTMYQSWAVANGLGAGAPPDADSDSDSVPNIQEYAFGMNPNVGFGGAITFDRTNVLAAGKPLPWLHPITANSVDYRAVFARRKDYLAAGLVYTLQFSADMSQWVTQNTNPTVMANEGNADIEAVYIPYPLFIQTANGFEKPRFFRVGVSFEP